MYLETMEKVLADIDKVIIDKNASSGVVPYLPLPELKKKKTNSSTSLNCLRDKSIWSASAARRAIEHCIHKRNYERSRENFRFSKNFN